jgi:hypothetical protein
MSTVNQKNLKILLPRTGPDVFWQTIFEEFAQEDDRKWRYLAMLALRENSGWSLEHIAKLFKHKTGHVSRCLLRIKEELRDVFIDPIQEKGRPDSVPSPLGGEGGRRPDEGDNDELIAD